MKILIVDDEELTRTGVISSINWGELGIDEVLQADDGINGLAMARAHRPEIILCDVRMPRMDGIRMLEQIEAELPDTISIFMSGYSDKEYLKAAIKLKTVSYIEKPLDPAEIREAVLEAKERFSQKQHTRRGEALQSMQTASQLALLLTVPYDSSNRTSISLLEKELNLNFSSGVCISAVLIRLQNAPDGAQAVYDEIFRHIRDFLKSFHMNCIFMEKKPQHLVYFVYGQTKPSAAALSSARAFIGSQFEPLGNFHFAAGEPGTGISSAYPSYAAAVVLLQSSFFFPSGTLLTAGTLENVPQPSPLPGNYLSLESAFSEALSSKKQESCDEFLANLFRHYEFNRTLMPNQVRDVYYKLFLTLDQARRQQHVINPEKSDSAMDALENSFTFHELHQILVTRTHDYLHDVRDAQKENTTIFLIKDYISKHYMEETLSVKDISSHVFLSVSYVCTFFKNETGQTLNQYLTEYRMEKAKELLADSRCKIAEISSRVGYSDGNYFGKSFKKYSGLSPSEFRERMA